MRIALYATASLCVFFASMFAVIFLGEWHLWAGAIAAPVLLFLTLWAIWGLAGLAADEFIGDPHDHI